VLLRLLSLLVVVNSDSKDGDFFTPLKKDILKLLVLFKNIDLKVLVLVGHETEFRHKGWSVRFLVIITKLGCNNIYDTCLMIINYLILWLQY
jgi:hypothetical protein